MTRRRRQRGVTSDSGGVRDSDSGDRLTRPAPPVSGGGFGQPGEDLTGSAALTDPNTIDLSADSPDLLEAMSIHGLIWAES
jgi:hypothetical protein